MKRERFKRIKLVEKIVGRTARTLADKKKTPLHSATQKRLIDTHLETFLPHLKNFVQETSNENFASRSDFRRQLHAYLKEKRHPLGLMGFSSLQIILPYIERNRLAELPEFKQYRRDENTFNKVESLLNQGLSKAQISRQLGVTPGTVTRHARTLASMKFDVLEPKYGRAAERLVKIARQVAKLESARHVRKLNHFKWRVIASRPFQTTPNLKELSHQEVEQILSHLIIHKRISNFAFDTGRLGVSAMRLAAVEQAIFEWLSSGRKESVSELAKKAGVKERSMNTFLFHSGLVELKQA